ncbi:MAG: hypothetical protein ABEJ22_09920 [Haloferacaceae archaeon]
MKRDTDRPRGILSPADREFLLGETEMTHEQSRRNAEARIRERVVNGVEDFELLVHAMRTKDRRQVFERAAEGDAFLDGLAAMLSFAYMGLKESGVEFEHVLEPAVRKAEEVYAADVLEQSVDVEVTFDVETTLRADVEEVTARIERGDAVTPVELFSLVIQREGSLPSVDDVVVQRGGGGARDDDGFVERLATYLDASVESLAGKRVRLILDAERQHPP